MLRAECVPSVALACPSPGLCDVKQCSSCVAVCQLRGRVRQDASGMAFESGISVGTCVALRAARPPRLRRSQCSRVRKYCQAAFSLAPSSALLPSPACCDVPTLPQPAPAVKRPTRQVVGKQESCPSKKRARNVARTLPRAPAVLLLAGCGGRLSDPLCGAESHAPGAVFCRDGVHLVCLAPPHPIASYSRSPLAVKGSIGRECAGLERIRSSKATTRARVCVRA